MAAKKKGAKKSKKGSSNDTSDGSLDLSIPENKIQYLETQISSYQCAMSLKSETNANLTRQYKSMKQQHDDLTKEHDEAKDTTVVLMKDMTRQYKGMQEDLLNKINTREQTVQELTDVVNKERMDHDRKLKEMDSLLQQKDEHIIKLEQKMEDLCTNFTQMLHEALEQMQETIRTQNAYYNENAIPIQHRLDQVDFKA